MKLFKRFLGGLGIAAILALSVTNSNAQIWAYYNMQINNQFFNPLTSATPPFGDVLNPLNFMSFSNTTDLDDGVVNDVPVGFNFDYNGNMYSTINVCVNGWVTVGKRDIPPVTNDKYYLFRPNEPNNTIAPFFGDHYFRTLADISNGYKVSRIWYNIDLIPDPNPRAVPGSFLHVFTLEWKDLNINDKSNINSIATFQLKLIENPNANDIDIPDKRVIIEFHYGPIGNNGNVKTQGCTVGIEDSIAYSWMNGLFPSSFAGEDSTRRNRDSLTTCWPPASCLPGRVIQFIPEGLATIAQWGDGDVNLTQQDVNQPANVRLNQSLFVTLADADMILASIAQGYPPMDSVEGRNAFHGDANHNGRYQVSPFQPYYFYKVTSYDAAYILMYLAAKLPFLPWLSIVPPYKEAASSVSNEISAIVLDGSQATRNGRTVMVPVVLRGSANGPLAFDFNVNCSNAADFQLVDAQATSGLVRANAKTGKVTFATTGAFENGTVLGYLQFVASENVTGSDIELSNIMINDENYPSEHSMIAMGVSGNTATNGFRVDNVFPNPFSVSSGDNVAIQFAINEAQPVSVKIFDQLGKEIYTGAAATFAAGTHQVKWDGRDNSGNPMAAGVYYYNLTAGGSTLTGKINLAK